VRQDLTVIGVTAGRVPGEFFRHANEGVENDVDGFETYAVGFEKRRILRRINVLVERHRDELPTDPCGTVRN
jgi:hypothetical protein